MIQKFRESAYVDFNTGVVKLAPIQLQFRMRMVCQTQFDDLVRLFECRVEVWHLGVAAQMVRAIEFSQPPEIWSHAAYGLLALLVPYFEMVGRLLDPAPITPGASPHSTLPGHFDRGFRDVYPDPTTTSGATYDPLEFYDLARQGLYGRGSSQHGLWLHNEVRISAKDFDIIQKQPDDISTRKHYVNPHGVVRTVIAHFPSVIARLNNPAAQYDVMRARLRVFVGDVSESES